MILFPLGLTPEVGLPDHMTACCFEATCWPWFLRLSDSLLLVSSLSSQGLLPGCPKTSLLFPVVPLMLTAGPALGCWQPCLLGWMVSEHLQGNLPLSVWPGVLLGPPWFPSCSRHVAILICVALLLLLLIAPKSKVPTLCQGVPSYGLIYSSLTS